MSLRERGARSFRAALVSTVAAIAVLAPMAGARAGDDGFQGKSAGDFMVRLRGIGVLPRDSADISGIGGNTSVSDDIVPELDFTYFVTDNIAFELIAATTHHDVHATGTSLGRVDLGSVRLLPPTLTAQWHFLPKERISPYVGAGINYTIFYDQDAPGGTVTDIDYDNSFGAALQVGVDVAVTDKVYLNVDVKRLWLSTDVKVNKGAIKADVDLDPWIVGFGVGYLF